MPRSKDTLENDTSFKKFAVRDTVAFNRSGDVVLGEVVKLNPVISRGKYYDWKQCNASIRAFDTGKISFVKSETSIAKVHPDSKLLNENTL